MSDYPMLISNKLHSFRNFMDAKLLSFCHFQIQMTQSFYFLNTNNADDTDKYKNNFVSSAAFGFKSNQNKSQVRISSLQ